MLTKLNLSGNKKGDFPTVLLVFMTVFTVLTTLFIFITNENNAAERIEEANLLDELYTKEFQINFFLSEVAEDTVKEMNNGFTGEEFKSKFLADVGSLELPYEEMKEVLRAENMEVKIEGSAVNVKVKGIKLVYDSSQEGTEDKDKAVVRMQYVYDYDENFPIVQ